MIKRYRQRKLYDTRIGELTSLRRIELLVRSGVDICVVDYETGNDVTVDILVGVLGNAVGERGSDDGVSLLTALIRAPDAVLRAISQDEQEAQELREMHDRVRLLSAAIDDLLERTEPSGAEPLSSRLAKSTKSRGEGGSRPTIDPAPAGIAWDRKSS